MLLVSWYPFIKEVSLDPYFTLHTNNSRGVEVINMKGKTLKLLEENTEELLLGLWIGKKYLTGTQKTLTMKEKC